MMINSFLGVLDTATKFNKIMLVLFILVSLLYGCHGLEPQPC